MKITKEQAIAKAIQIGSTVYNDVEPFEITTEDAPSYWTVNFSRPQALEDGERQHFSVWIDKESGEARLFKGR